MLKSAIKKIYFFLGILAFILGLLGMALPVLPTTPFILLAIFFFDRSSKKFHQMCLNIPGVGEKIEDWQSHRVIKTKSKIQAIVLILISAGVILLKEELLIEIKIATLCVLSFVTIFILLRPSVPKTE